MTALPADSPSPHAPTRERLRALAIARFEQSADVATHFVHGHASLIARACLEMSQRFRRGGRLLALGAGPAATDARHVTVEFVHPVIVGKRALPALAIEAELSAAGQPFERALALLGREDDIAMTISAGDGRFLRPALDAARHARMLTIALVGQAPERPAADFVFAVPSADALVVQEVHELVYHVLWELVHVFLENRGAA